MKLRARLSRAPLAMGLSTDPVCKKAVLVCRIVSEHDGEAYYFCSRACKTTFDTDPAKYLCQDTADDRSHPGDWRASTSSSGVAYISTGQLFRPILRSHD